MSTELKAATGLSRRNFLVSSLTAGGGLLLAMHWPISAEAATAATGKTLQPNAFIRLLPNGEVTLIVPFVEMGQGIFTSVAMLVAEELEVPLRSVHIEQAPANEAAYKHPIFGTQLTGGSASIRAGYASMRKAAATVRVLLVSAAAQQWKVKPESCKAENGQVFHAASGRHVPYTQLLQVAAKMPVPSDAALKQPTDFTVIGTARHRNDSADKVNGKALFGIDAKIPGMLHAAVVASPVLGGKVAKVDQAPALKVRGVKQVIVLDDAVAVIAEHTGAARKGLAALTVEWNDGANGGASTEQMQGELVQALKGKGIVWKEKGSFDDALQVAGSRQVSAVYHSPNLAHATMEPMNCTVHVTRGKCELWLGTQAPVRAQAAVVKLTGLPLDKVQVHNHLLGGGFGRRLDVDYVEQATRLAMQAKVPLKVTWSREEDMRHDVYRPNFYDEVSAVVDAQGRPTALKHRFSGSAVVARYAPQWMSNGVDTDAVDGAESSYDFDNLFVEFVAHEPKGVVTGFWRGVGPTHNMGVLENFIDELAAEAKQDPVAFRRSLLSSKPRALAVLDLAAEKAGWGQGSTVAGSGRGVAVVTSWNSYAAMILDATVAADGQVTVTRIVTAVDCGQAVNPDGVIAQMQGGHLYGLTAALFGKITVKDGRVEQSNFHDYPILRMNQAPKVEVHVVNNHEDPGGVGEIGTAVVMPALLNAVFAATGKRLRDYPVDPAVLRTV